MLGVTIVMGALAVSAYRTYAVRSQIAVSVMGAAAIQQRVARAFSATVLRLRTLKAAGLAADLAEAAAEFVESVQIVNGRIELHFGRSADAAIMGSVLSLTPFETAEQDVVWICGNRAPSVGLQPLGFVGGSRQATQMLTTIDARYLPSICR